MRQIIGIGGGSLQLGQTLPLDRAILELTGKDRPRVLFIPTASDDDPAYVREFHTIYRGCLGADTDSLLLWSQPEASEEKIVWADAVYVGGGNTRKMVAYWRKLGIDRILDERSRAGLVLSGLSAGLNCWFRDCNSDAPQYEGVPGVLTDRVEGLGFVPLTVCPHYDGEPFRRPEFRKMMAGICGRGLGLEDGCAIQVRGDAYRILACAGKRAYWVWGDGEEAVEPFDEFRPLPAA